MSYEEGMKISKGGKLLATVWDKKQKQDVDITNQLFDKLYDHCEIEDGVLLKDIFILVNAHTNTLSGLLTQSPTWLKEIIDEGLNSTIQSKNDSKIEWLELSHCAEINNYYDKNRKDLDDYVSFNGVGDPPDEEHYKNWPVGQKERYALDFSPAYELINFPLKLNKNCKIYDNCKVSKKEYKHEVVLEVNREFKLIDILRAIFWEMSFMGGPKDRDVKSVEIMKSIDDIDSGKAKTIPWEEVKKNLGWDKDEDDI